MLAVRPAKNGARRRQAGFTLIELLVVIAILGILIAIAAPTIRGFLETSKEQAFEADQRVIQLAIDAYYYSATNETFKNRRQFPIVGRRWQPKDGERGIYISQGGESYTETYAKGAVQSCGGVGVHDPIEFDWESYEKAVIISGDLPLNTVLGTTGGVPQWREGGGSSEDGIRNNAGAADESLYCPEDPDGPGDLVIELTERKDHWIAADLRSAWGDCSTMWVSACLVVDSRDFFIDFCELVDKGFLDVIPRSASADHGKCEGQTLAEAPDGSYTWYVDPDGRVQSLYYFYPSRQNDGFEDGVFP